MRRFLVLLSLCCLAGCSLKEPEKQQAKAVIKGPAKAKPGEIVVLDARNSVGQLCRWQVDACCQGASMDNGWRMVLVAVKSGSHKVELEVWTVQDGRLSVDTTSHIVEIVANPDDPPTPGPGPQPPDVPDSKWGLVRWATSAAETHVHSSNRMSEAKQVAGVFSAVASQIASGSLSNTVEVQAATMGQIDSRLGSARPAWEGWMNAFMEKSRTTFRHDSPLNDIAEGWREISKGLESVR